MCCRLRAGPAFITKDATLLDWPAAPALRHTCAQPHRTIPGDGKSSTFMNELTVLQQAGYKDFRDEVSLESDRCC
jgi:hypothetical protein